MRTQEQNREASGETTDAVNQVKGKYQTYNIPLCLIFEEFEKAFDSMEIDNILRALEEKEIKGDGVEFTEN
ncbi:Hypothetical predicted protein [Octopus vulgaris]|uniref:Reverse transcriptase domain-containing protein n=1 Tax=Octopus vulgaris TaxID=6645 RepID=A0AA36AM44_OCTVU|nr:Hypothetical predicted protein [Octopus vulgaris]